MKKTLTFILALFMMSHLNSQTYAPFPTDTAEWNCLFWHQWSANDFYLFNSSYLLEGDTTLKGISYKKVYFDNVDFPGYQPEYLGGLRENDNKEIYFFPVATSLNLPGPVSFPNDTSEHLLYTFHNLTVGMQLPINPDFNQITVTGIDSVLLGNHYRKRYQIEQSGLFSYDYWIEGIGSIKDLFIPYTYEFEWTYYTLCFTDTLTCFINSPNGEDSCHYMLPVGLNETMVSDFSLFPNPASTTIQLKTNTQAYNGLVTIYNTQGQAVLRREFLHPETEFNIEKLIAGIYMVEIAFADKKLYRKFIKQ